MVDFKIEWDRFKREYYYPLYINKRYNVICKIVGSSKESIELRPINYNGCMTYSIIFGSPICDEWELCGTMNTYETYYYSENIMDDLDDNN